LGAVAAEHRTDSLPSAVNNMSNLEEFNRRYEGVMRYYGVKPQHTNPASPNENGDCEQSHLTGVMRAGPVTEWLGHPYRAAVATFSPSSCNHSSKTRPASIGEVYGSY
jgi:hypothetical protein